MLFSNFFPNSGFMLLEKKATAAVALFIFSCFKIRVKRQQISEDILKK